MTDKALVLGASLADLYQVQATPATGEVFAKMGMSVMLKYGRIMLFTRKPEVARARIGAMALNAVTESEAERRKVIESRLPVRDWPAGRLQITAVDAVSGEFTVFDAASGVGLVDAVGASCAVPGIWPPVTIGERRYVDGGMRSAANADLAGGHQRVVVIAPLSQGIGAIESLKSQVHRLTAQGTRVAVIKPDKAALRAIGRNVLDPARRPAAARAGHEQAASQASAAAAFWSV